MQKTCANCSQVFEVMQEDQAFLEKIDVPLPTHCPRCRYIRRHGFINDYSFYLRTCDKTGERFVSIYPPDCGYVVYCQDAWYCEERDDKAEGRDWDPDRSFFKQFDELMHAAPLLGIIGQNNENCNYCESVANCKNCYLISECSNCEDCYYSYWIQKSQDCFDCNYAHECVRCYEIDNCFNCSRLQYSRDCSDCHDSAFLDNCAGCRDCLLSTNLRQKQYHIFNEPHTNEEYEKKRKELGLGSFENVRKLKEEYASFVLTQPRRWLQVENIEHCTGNYIRNAKNCFEVYHCYDAEDCRYGEHIWRGAKNCMDCNSAGRNAEVSYESTNSGIDSYNVKFCRYCWGCRETEYSNQCKQGSWLFGCVSLKPGARFCILNKQYNEEGWKALVKNIKEKMRADGEYGEFFPLSISPFGFNNTVSCDAFPLLKEEALEKGWKWEDVPTGTKDQGTIDMEKLPDAIANTEDTICDEVLTCEATSENYRITPRELEFYKDETIPLPRRCPMRRLRDRLALHPPPMTLFQRSCTKCGKETPTSYSPDRPEIVYCEECYMKEVY